jgi:tetratricopeptide (TPR) repeat protein/predicted Ser/Thr protein kinase
MAPPQDTLEPPPDPLQALVAECLELWEETGASALDELCARHPEQAAALRQRIDALRGLGLLDGAADAPLPERIRDYRVVRVLGRGGMGVVFEAEQESPSRRVAVKVLRMGLESPALKARFAHEALLLARLQHPGIAQIYEAGSATVGGEELPFFAMELVRGVPVTQFAQENGLDARARLELLTIICEAVQHAHQKGVIHRDLKPSNVLVDGAGRPKLLDFGVARATEAELHVTRHTRLGQIVGTLAYMSPEQASGDPDDVDTRSDVYSLGVIAHELLAGELPYSVEGLRLADAVRVITDRPPVRLGALDRTLRGDVETVVLMALAKEKDRRYASAAGFAADIRRCLHDEPIAARAPTTWYTLRKFARRNRALVIGAAGIVLALGLGLAGTLRGMFAAQRAQAAAERRWQEARAAFDFQRKMLASAQPFGEGRDARIIDVIDLAAMELDGAYPGQPGVEASLRVTMAETFHTLGVTDRAEAQFTSGLGLLRDALGEAAPETVMAAASFASFLVDVGQLERARGELERARPAATQAAADPAVRDARANLRLVDAKLLRAEGRHGEAVALQRAVLDELRATKGVDSDDAVEAGKALAQMLRLAGDAKGAVQILEDLLGRTTAQFGERHPRTITMQLSLAAALTANGRIQDSRMLLDRLIPLARERLGPDQPDTLAALSAAGLNALELGESARAEALYRELLASAEGRFGPLSPLVLAGRNNLAGALGAQGKWDEAEAILRPLVEALRERRGPEHFETLTAMHVLATTLKNAKRHAEALPLMEEVLALRRKALGSEHPSTIRSIRNLGLLLSDLQRFEEADGLLREAADTARRVLAQQDFITGDLLAARGGNLVKMGRLDEAEPLLRDGHAWLARTLGDDKPATRRVAKEIHALYLRLEKPEAAAEWERRALGQR